MYYLFSNSSADNLVNYLHQCQSFLTNISHNPKNKIAHQCDVFNFYLIRGLLS